VVGQPVLSDNYAVSNFTVSGSLATVFHLLQAAQLSAGTWVTNSTAVFTTSSPGISYRFTATNTHPIRFYRVQTPGWPEDLVWLHTKYICTRLKL
jgi:hypothetical protein